MTGENRECIKRSLHAMKAAIESRSFQTLNSHTLSSGATYGFTTLATRMRKKMEERNLNDILGENRCNF